MLAVVGPTGCGKTDLGLRLAKLYGGEIICADSRTVYKGMDIGTAKPSSAARHKVKHYLLDLVEPNQPFTARDYQQCAFGAIQEVFGRNRLPIMVGGTGLYVDSVLYDYSFPTATNTAQRHELSRLPVEELQQRVLDMGISLGRTDWHNPRRLIRAIETGGAPAVRAQLRPNTLILGVRMDPEELKVRIATRAEQMLDAGLLQEVEQLVRRYGQDVEALSAIGYREFVPVVLGQRQSEAAIGEMVRNTLRYAKRQMTWFGRNPDIVWVGNDHQAVERAAHFLGQPVRA